MRTVRFLVVLLLLLIPAANSFSINKHILDNYYPDATFTTAVADYEKLCDGTVYQDGTFTNYRYHEEWICGLQSYWASCQEWNSSTGQWDNVACQDEATTLGGRLRVPIG